MANRFWVGGTGTWDYSSTTHWSASSGGGAGASAPTTADSVYLDGNSGAGTITCVGRCLGLDCTGYIGTLSMGYLYCKGSLTFTAGMTYTGAGTVYLTAISGSHTITSAGKTIATLRSDDSVSATWTLQDNLTLGSFHSFYGSFDFNNKNVTCNSFLVQGTDTTQTFTLGSGTFKVGSFSVTDSYNKITIVPGASTIELDNSTDVVSFSGAGKTYNILKLSGSSSVNIHLIYGSNTFAEVIIDRSVAAKTIKWETGKNNTISTFTCAVSGTRICTMRSTTTTNSTITKVGAAVQLYYMDCDYITGQAASKWYMGNTDTGSVDGGHNSQLYFTNPALTDPGNVYADDANYATAATYTGDISVKISGDAGSTYSTILTKTFGAGETAETFGAGSAELWGESWIGSETTDANLRLKIEGVGFEQVYKTFGFTGPAADAILNGIEVVVKAKWNGTTVSINYIKTKIYYSKSILGLQASSQAYASDGRKAGEGAGAGTGVLCFYDGTNWIACDTGATVAA